MDTTEQLLAEFRTFRDVEFREFREEQNLRNERLTRLEAQSKTAIVDNGQPSRLTCVEDKVDALENFKSWSIGAAAVVSVLVSAFIGFFAWVLK